MANPGDTAGFAPVTSATAEDIRALEAYLATPQGQAASQKAKGGAGATVQLFVGIPLLAASAIGCFSTGRTFLGVVLLPFLAFAIVLAVLTLKDRGSSGSAVPSAPASPVERLRAAGELDAAARDFPREAQEPGDHIRYGSGYAFDRDQRAVYAYAQIQRLQVKELAKGGQTVALTLEARLREGGTKTLYVGGGTDEDRQRIASICQRVQRGNPFVQVG